MHDCSTSSIRLFGRLFASCLFFTGGFPLRVLAVHPSFTGGAPSSIPIGHPSSTGGAPSSSFEIFPDGGDSDPKDHDSESAGAPSLPRHPRSVVERPRSTALIGRTKVEDRDLSPLLPFGARSSFLTAALFETSDPGAYQPLTPLLRAVSRPFGEKPKFFFAFSSLTGGETSDLAPLAGGAPPPTPAGEAVLSSALEASAEPGGASTAAPGASGEDSSSEKNPTSTSGATTTTSNKDAAAAETGAPPPGKNEKTPSATEKSTPKQLIDHSKPETKVGLFALDLALVLFLIFPIPQLIGNVAQPDRVGKISFGAQGLMISML